MAWFRLAKEVAVTARALAATLFLVCVATSASAEQQAPLTIVLRTGQDAAEVEKILDAAAQTGRPLVVQWQPVEETNGPSPVSEVADSGLERREEAVVVAFMRGVTIALGGLSGVAALFSTIGNTLAGEERGLPGTIGVAAGAIVAGAVVAILLRRAVAKIRAPRDAAQGLPATLRLAFKALALDLLCLGVFALLSFGAIRVFLPAGSLSATVAETLAATVMVGGLYAAIGRLLFAGQANGAALIAIARPCWHMGMLIAYGTIGSFIGGTVRLVDSLHLDKTAVEGWFLIGTTVLTLLKLWWFVAGRRDISGAFIGSEPGAVRRAAGAMLPYIYALSAILIWLAGFLVTGTPESAAWSFAAGTTQIVLVATPIVALGLWSLLSHFARGHEARHGADLLSTFLWGARTGLSGAGWLIGLHLIAALWQPLMKGDAAGVSEALAWLERVSLALVASWTICTLLWRYFDMVAPQAPVLLPGQEEADEAARKQKSRLSTVMPVVRNLTLGAVLAIIALLVLSSMGVDVTPLLAGFGVVGLALSFGSQTLVKDIVSGIFFIADDAFRVGEYIDTGKQVGTVEHISLRSVRLRHHNGPLNTVPFGQIGSVTNYSRDWGTTKFELRFDRDSDAELIRKTAKKVGEALLTDPELGPEFLVPLKMQGIKDITETSMIVRFKFTSRPGNPGILKRESLKRLLVAFKAANLSLASNAVTVRSGASVAAVAEEAAAATLLRPSPQTGKIGDVETT